MSGEGAVWRRDTDLKLGVEALAPQEARERTSERARQFGRNGFLLAAAKTMRAKAWASAKVMPAGRRDCRQGPGRPVVPSESERAKAWPRRSTTAARPESASAAAPREFLKGAPWERSTAEPNHPSVPPAHARFISSQQGLHVLRRTSGDTSYSVRRASYAAWTDGR